MNFDIDDDQKKELENWPIFGSLTKVVIASAPKQGLINLYMAAGENKVMFQITKEQTQSLIGNLSEALDHISRGVQ